MWFVAPAVIILFILLFSGFMVRKYVENILKSTRSPIKPQVAKKKTQVRLIGWILLIIALSIWTYGVVNPLDDKLYIWGIVICLYCLIFGLYNIAKNRSF